MTVDDEFAKSLGLESLAKLRDAVKDRLAREHGSMSRQKVKRAAARRARQAAQVRAAADPGRGGVRPGLEVGQQDLKRASKTFEDEDTTEEKAKEEYRAIAERRVRLGLVIAEIGEKNNITVTDEELNRAVVEQVRQFPGQEKQVYDYYRQNPEAVAGLRAPIFEEKVVDFLLELAEVTENKVSREELYKEDESRPPREPPACGSRARENRSGGRGPGGWASLSSILR